MRLYNTQTRKLEEFTTPNGTAGIYVCGITPYDTTHIGHAFTFLTFDILTRYLRHQGIDVTYVQNVTDIDDDILRKAREVGMGWRELGTRETERYRADMRSVNALEFDHYVAATEHIAEIVALTEALIERGLAYVASGNVYYSVGKDPDFGKLSHLDRDEMLPIANERGNNPDDPNKQHPLDFVLWQAGTPGEPTWSSPWGEGRPGWHVECTAMATRYLGPQIDIHGGGYDLIFPHHECEIAQAEPVTGVVPYVRYWMHVAMVDYQGEKMSKSLGNLVLVGDILKEYSADALRLYLFSHHYREPWEYKDEEMEEWAAVAADLQEAAAFESFGVDNALNVDTFKRRFFDAMDDDFDTPGAIAALRELGTAILEAPEEDDIRQAQATLRDLAGILGLTLGTS